MILFKKDTREVISELQPTFIYNLEPIKQRESIYSINYENSDIIYFTQKPQQRVKFQMRQSKKPRKIIHTPDSYSQFTNSYLQSNRHVYKLDPRSIMTTNKHKFIHKKCFPIIIANHSRRNSQISDIHITKISDYSQKLFSFKQYMNLKSLKLKQTLESDDYNHEIVLKYFYMEQFSPFSLLQDFSFDSNFTSDFQFILIGDVIRKCQNLKSLKIKFVEGFCVKAKNSNSLGYLFESINYCEKLTELEISMKELEFTEFCNGELYVISTLLDSAKNLKSFKLEFIGRTLFGMTRNEFSELWDIENEYLFKNLKVLEINFQHVGKTFDTDQLQPFVKILKQCTNLCELGIKLDVTEQFLDNENHCLEELYTLICQSYKNLEKLEMHLKNDVEYDYSKHNFIISDSLESSIKSFNVRNLFYNSLDGRKHILEQLSQINHLEELYIYNLECKNLKIIKMFNQLCKNQKQLKHLSLQGLNGESLQMEFGIQKLLKESFSELTNLSECQVDMGEDFGRDLIPYFVYALENCKQLTKLSICTGRYCVYSEWLDSLSIVIRNNYKTLANLDLTFQSNSQIFRDSDISTLFSSVSECRQLSIIKIGLESRSIEEKIALILVESLSQLPVLEKVYLNFFVDNSDEFLDSFKKLNLKQLEWHRY